MLSSSARRLQPTTERQHLTVIKKVTWCRAIPFQHFPKENVIFKSARINISIPTTRAFGKYPRVRQICPQMEMLFFSKPGKWIGEVPRPLIIAGPSSMACCYIIQPIITPTFVTCLSSCIIISTIRSRVESLSLIS